MSKRGEMSGGTVDCAFIPSSPYVELHTSQPLCSVICRAKLACLVSMVLIVWYILQNP